MTLPDAMAWALMRTEHGAGAKDARTACAGQHREMT